MAHSMPETQIIAYEGARAAWEITFVDLFGVVWMFISYQFLDAHPAVQIHTVQLVAMKVFRAGVISTTARVRAVKSTFACCPCDLDGERTNPGTRAGSGTLFQQIVHMRRAERLVQPRTF